MICPAPVLPGASRERVRAYCATAVTKFSASGVPTPVTLSQPGPVTSDESVPNVMTNQRVENGLL